MSLKLIFAGTPEFAKHHLQALLDHGYDICAVYTQPDRPAGRGKKVQASAVKTLALEHNLPVLQPVNLKGSDEQQQLAAFKADLMVVVAYGLLLPKAVLETPRLGCINVHGSLLPAWRGAAPIQRAIEAGDTESGITIMQMDEGLDTGDMLLKVTCPILPHDCSTDLHDRLCTIGPKALLDGLASIASGTSTPEKQNDAQSSYAKKIEKQEAKIDWSEPAQTICRKIRAFNPFPVAYCLLGEQRVRIHRAQVSDMTSSKPAGTIEQEASTLAVHCGEGVISVEALQLAGKKTMSTQEFMNGPAQHLLLDKFC